MAAVNDNIPPPPPGPPALHRQIYSYGTNNVHYWVNRYNHYKDAGEIEDANEIRRNAIIEFLQHNWDHALNNPPAAHGGRRARRRRSTRRRRKRKSSTRRKPRRKTRRRKTSRRRKSRRR